MGLRLINGLIGMWPKPRSGHHQPPKPAPSRPRGYTQSTRVRPEGRDARHMRGHTYGRRRECPGLLAGTNRFE
jgi:hypothetical protein